MTATKAFSAVRRRSRKLGKQLPFRSFGISSAIRPARPPRGNGPPDHFLTLVDPVAVVVSVALNLPQRGARALGRT